MTIVACGRSWIGELIFGDAGCGNMVVLLAAVLGVVVFDNFFTSLYTALRQVKFVSLTQFTNSMVFALLGVGLVLMWSRTSEAVVLAFCGACVATTAVSLARLGWLWTSLPSDGEALSHRSLWVKLAPFALWLWLTNWLANLSAIADRLMIIHWSGLSADGALNMVGQYHTARLFPLLMVGVAELLGAIVTPHLSCDWERGRRDLVSQRLVLMLKSFGLMLSAGAALILIAAPILFDLVWQERFADGLRVLPWALACAVWTGMSLLSNTYLWCAEKSRYVCLTLAVALALNLGLSYLWLPSMGLLGAALAAAVARLAALALLWWLTWRLGLQLDRGVLAVAVLPALLGFGPWIALAGLAVVLMGLVPGVRCFNDEERQRLLSEASLAWGKCRRFFHGRRVLGLRP
jgi:O-antigen/teichoic acid export membrane protein